MIELLTNKHISDTLNKVISENFRPIEYIKIEEDITSERQNTNEYSIRYYANIQNKEESFYENKRPFLDVFIRFNDNTGFKMKLRPEDYLGRIRETNFKMKDKIPQGLDVNNHITFYYRNYDLNKMLNTILSALKEKKQYNPTFETLDLLTPSQSD